MKPPLFHDVDAPADHAVNDPQIEMGILFGQVLDWHAFDAIQCHRIKRDNVTHMVAKSYRAAPAIQKKPSAPGFFRKIPDSYGQ